MSTTKKVTIETSKKKYYFVIKESSGIYDVYQTVSFGWISDDNRKIGRARSLNDAIELAKTNVEGSVRDVDIQ